MKTPPLWTAVIFFLASDCFAQSTSRLHAALASAGIPIDGVSGLVCGTPNTARIDFKPEATAQQQLDAQAILLAFDCSPAAQTSFENTQSRAAAVSAIDNDKTDKLKLLRAVAKVMIDEINILRGVVVAAGSLVFDPANLANATGTTSANITVTGAAFGDYCDVAAPYTLQAITATCYVSAANTAVIRLHNGTGGAINLGSGTWNVIIRRQGALNPRTLAQAIAAIKNEINAGSVD